MAFKMKGWSAFTKQTDVKLKTNILTDGDLSVKSNTKANTKTNIATRTKKNTSGSTAVKRFFKAHTSNIPKQAVKKVAKKIGTRLIPGLGTIALGADIVKEIKSGGAGIKKNIKDVKNFLTKNKKTNKTNKNVKNNTKKKTYLDKRNLDYIPQSKRKD